MNIESNGKSRFMRKYLNFIRPLIFVLSLGFFGAMAQPIGRPLDSNDPKGLLLGPGVPRVVDTNGNVIYIPLDFTTRRYEIAAFALMLQEANRVAKEMRLPEHLPITESNVVSAFVGSFGISYLKKAIGTIATTNFNYYFAKGDKFNNLVVANYYDICLNLEKYRLPPDEMDTNDAFELATQFLAAAGMNVAGLNRDCTVHVAATPWVNGLSRLGQRPNHDFVPIYYIWWTTPEEDTQGFGATASVELFLPATKGRVFQLTGDVPSFTKIVPGAPKLLQLDVDDAQYILRKPLTFANLASLFPGKATISVFKNFPTGPTSRK